MSEVGGKLFEGPTKTRATRSISLPPFLRYALDRHIAAFRPGRDGVVFTSPEGSVLRPRNFRSRVSPPAVREAGLEPLRVHDLRHMCAELMIGQGAPIKAVADRLGHSSPVVTLNTYAHILPCVEDQINDRLDTSFRAAGAAAAAYAPPDAAAIAAREHATPAEPT